jgi:hypothetical protein
MLVEHKEVYDIISDDIVWVYDWTDRPLEWPDGDEYDKKKESELKDLGF